MTGTELITKFRLLSQDTALPYHYEDENILIWLNEAEREVAARQRLIKDNATPAVVDVAVVSGGNVYPVHPKIISCVTVALIDDAGEYVKDLVITTRGELDDTYPGWRSTPDNEPECIIHDDNQFVLVPTPAADYSLKLDVVRFPMVDFTELTEPEVAEVHHDYMVYYALYKAYMMQDSDTFSPRLSAYYQQIFDTKYGGTVIAGSARRGRSNRYHRARICL
jgi:hypothetical protein